MHTLKIAALFVGLGLASACASFQERVYPYHASIYSWIGAPIKEVINSWGPPDSNGALDGGRQAYVWNKSPVLCPTTLVTDAKGKVVNFNPEGTAEGCANAVPLPARAAQPR